MKLDGLALVLLLSRLVSSGPVEGTTPESDDLGVVLTAGETTQAWGPPVEADFKFAVLSFSSLSAGPFIFDPLEVPACAAEGSLIYMFTLALGIPEGSATLTLIGNNSLSYRVVVSSPSSESTGLSSKHNQLTFQCGNGENDPAHSKLAVLPSATTSSAATLAPAPPTQRSLTRQMTSGLRATLTAEGPGPLWTSPSCSTANWTPSSTPEITSLPDPAALATSSSSSFSEPESFLSETQVAWSFPATSSVLNGAAETTMLCRCVST